MTEPTGHDSERALVDFVAALVALSSENPPGNECVVERAVIDFARRERLAYERVPVTETRANLVVRIPGRSAARPLAFTGHMDVVPVGPVERDAWHTDPYVPTRRGRRLYGRGAADMKGGLAAMLWAAAAMTRGDITPPQDVYLLITCDEENTMRGSRTLLTHPAMSKIRDLVVGEPTGMTLCRVSRGRTYADVTLHGKTAHGSRPGTGTNAIDVMVDVVEALRHTAYATHWQPLATAAGCPPDIVPDRCTVRLDCRLAPHETTEERLCELTDTLDRMARPHGYDVCVIDRREPWTTPADHPLVRAVGRYGPVTETVFTGSTDANVLAEAGMAPIIIGPGDLNVVHQANEFVDLDDVVRAFRLYRALMVDGVEDRRQEGSFYGKIEA